MSECEGDIIEYEPSMAIGVAEMLNKFKESWPGGFGGGAPFDEERVRDWLDETTSIADYIAVDEEGVPVGICTLVPHWRDDDAAYVTSSHTAEPWGFPIGNLRSTTHLFFRLEDTSRSIEQIG